MFVVVVVIVVVFVSLEVLCSGKVKADCLYCVVMTGEVKVTQRVVRVKVGTSDLTQQGVRETL